jgi:hypothetical protein
MTKFVEFGLPLWIIAIAIAVHVLKGVFMATPTNPLQPLEDKLDEIIANQANAKRVSDILIADFEKLLGGQTSGTVNVDAAELSAMLAKAQTISDGLSAEAAAEAAADPNAAPKT